MRGVGLGGGGERLDDEIVDGVVLVTEGERVEREGADAFEAVDQEFAVAALFRVFDGEDGGIGSLNVGIERAERAFRLVDQGIDAVGIEVGVGQRTMNRLNSRVTLVRPSRVRATALSSAMRRS